MDRYFLPKSKKLPRRNDDTKMPRSKRLCNLNHQRSISAVNHADQSTLQISELTEKDIQLSNENANCASSNGSTYILENLVSNGTEGEKITNDNISANMFNFSHTSCVNNVINDWDNLNFILEPIDIINSDDHFSPNDAVFHKNATSYSSDHFQNNQTLSSETSQLVTSNKETSQIENFDTTQDNSSQPENYFSNESEMKINTSLSSPKTPIIKHNQLREIMSRAMSPKSKDETTSLYSEYNFKSICKETGPVKSSENLLPGMLPERPDDNTEINKTNNCYETFPHIKLTIEQDTMEFQSISSSPLIPSKQVDLDESYKASVHDESESEIAISTEVKEFQGISTPTPSLIPLKGVAFEENNTTKTLFKLSEPIQSSGILLISTSPLIPSKEVDLGKSYKTSIHDESENKIAIPTKVNEFQGISAPTTSLIPLKEVDFETNDKAKPLFKFSEPITPFDTLTYTISTMARETVTEMKMAEDILTVPKETAADEHNSAFKFSEPVIVYGIFQDRHSSNSSSEDFEKDLGDFITFVSCQLRLLPRHISLECQKTMMETLLNVKMKLLPNHQNDSPVKEITSTSGLSFENYI